MFRFFGRKQCNLNEVLEVLYKENYARVYRAVFALTRDKLITEDAVQEAFFKAFGKLEKLKDKGKFSSWVTTIAVNEAKDMLKSRARHRIVPIHDQISLGSADQRISNLEVQDEVDRVLVQLKLSDKEILILKYFCELSIEELAEVLGISPSTAKVRLHRARLNFRNILEAESVLDAGVGGES